MLCLIQKSSRPAGIAERVTHPRPPWQGNLRLHALTYWHPVRQGKWITALLRPYQFGLLQVSQTLVLRRCAVSIAARTARHNACRIHAAKRLGVRIPPSDALLFCQCLAVLVIHAWRLETSILKRERDTAIRSAPLGRDPLFLDSATRHRNDSKYDQYFFHMPPF